MGKPVREKTLDGARLRENAKREPKIGIPHSRCRFSTGFGVSGGSALFHEFYSREVTNPVHLTVDTAFRNEKATIKAFVSTNLSLRDQQLAAQFQEIPLDLCMIEAEQIG